jgi:hypothetical protein
MDIVDWSILAASLKFYEAIGYRRIEAPWFQPHDVIAETCPEPSGILTVPGFGGLVGSAEQSLMAADFEGNLGSGKFVSLTPCFRNEPVIDRLHMNCFMKVELYDNERCDADSVSAMLETARRFMEVATGHRPSLLPTAEGFDLMIGSVEVGSYGIRTRRGKTWVYGTGVAEPRLTTAVRMLKE